jgi:tyrosine-protein phosphatase OCA1
VGARVVQDNEIEVVRIGEEGFSAAHPSASSKASQPSEELVLRGLRQVVDANKYPLLLVDLYGKHRIGVLVGCLRKLQRWNLISVRHDGTTPGGKASLLKPLHFEFRVIAFV